MRNVRFGSKADVCDAQGHVRFTPNSDRESVFSQRTMSALPQKADILRDDRERIESADEHRGGQKEM